MSASKLTKYGNMDVEVSRVGNT